MCVTKRTEKEQKFAAFAIGFLNISLFVPNFGPSNRITYLNESFCEYLLNSMFSKFLNLQKIPEILLKLWYFFNKNLKMPKNSWNSKNFNEISWKIPTTLDFFQKLLSCVENIHLENILDVLIRILTSSLMRLMITSRPLSAMVMFSIIPISHLAT
jgi:hypothetical protein